jgi:hypothetical protein
MKLNTLFFTHEGYNPPIREGHATPTDLAEVLVYDRWWWQRKWGNAPLSENGLRQLVEMVFYASMSPEEGRFPRFKVTTNSHFGVARLESVLLRDAEVLRRLAPACTHPDCALLVSERDGKLWCDGIVNVGTLGWDWSPGLPGTSSGGHPPMYQMTVRDPGHVAGSGMGSFELRAGTIRRLCSYTALQPVMALHHEFTCHLKRTVVDKAGPEAAAMFGGIDRSLQADGFFLILSRMLRMAIEGRHGGAFVVLPAGADPRLFGLRPKYSIDELHLGVDAAEFWLGCVEYAQSDRSDQALLRRTNVLRTRMMMDAETLGNMSMVDGCVVLDRSLRGRAFGTEIVVPDGDARQSPRAFRNVISYEEWAYDDFMHGIGGTRHRSAARLCRVYPNVIVFVVSQDGEFKIICSDDGQVNAFGPLDLPIVDTLLA